MKNPVSHVELGFVFIGGEGGIRTPGRLLYLRRFSKPLPSATQPPLRLHGISLNCQNIFNMPHVSNKANLFSAFFLKNTSATRRKAIATMGYKLVSLVNQ